MEASHPRHISLTSITCKLFERLIIDVITERLDSLHLLHDVQHETMNDRPCFANCLSVLTTVTKAIDDGEEVHVWLSRALKSAQSCAL